MQTQTVKRPAQAHKDCIGCADCTGLCRDLLDMASLPQMVLKASVGAR